MKLLDQYLYAIESYLPADIRQDFSRELRANIEEMLPEHPTQSQVYEVLKALGNPLRLAEEYTPNKKYLIGPAFYHTYVWVLKLVVTLTVMVAVLFTMLDWAFTLSSSVDLVDAIVGFIVNFMAAAVNGAIQGTFWVTFAFIIVERTGAAQAGIGLYSKDWTPDDLPQYVSENSHYISRLETAVEMVFLVLGTSFIYLRPDLIAIFLNIDSNHIETIPFFNLIQLNHYMLALLILMLTNLIILLGKIIWARWSRSLAIANLIVNVFNALFVLVLIFDTNILNPKFATSINQALDLSSPAANQWLLATKVVTVLIIMGALAWDSIQPFRKLKRHTK